MHKRRLIIEPFGSKINEFENILLAEIERLCPYSIYENHDYFFGWYFENKLWLSIIADIGKNKELKKLLLKEVRR